MEMHRRRGRAAFALVITFACAACAAPLRNTPKLPPSSAAAAASSARAVGRPTVGVAFGGGSARGIAHVGEEVRRPIARGISDLVRSNLQYEPEK